MEVWVKTGNSMNFPNMHRPRISDCLKLIDRQITKLPLNRFQILKDSLRVVCSRAGLGQ